MANDADELAIRPAADSDSAGLIALINTVFGEYPNCYLDVDNEMPELKAPARCAREEDGYWWVADAGGKLVGSCAMIPDADGVVELKRLYVAKPARRRGLGAQFVAMAEREARERGATRVELWSDTRFAEAHQLYEKLGYVKQPRTRALPDISKSIEFHYVKELR